MDTAVATLNTPEPLRLAVLISGYGSNLQAIIDAIDAGTLPARIDVVVSDHADAYGLVRAKQYGIRAHHLCKTDHPTRQAFDDALLAILANYTVDWVVLAGYMRLLSPAFVKQYPRRIINIHPSLLPKYRGLNTYERVLASGDTTHGTSVHIVTEDLDAGPILAQARCPVTPNMIPADLKAKVQTVEHQLYPTVLAWIARGELVVDAQTIRYRGHPLHKPITWAGAD